MDESKFEDQWKQAVTGAEVEPSGAVWGAVASALMEAENKKMKRMVVFYRRLAAASAIFAISLGAIGYYYVNNQDKNPSANATGLATSGNGPSVMSKQSDPAEDSLHYSNRATQTAPLISPTQITQTILLSDHAKRQDFQKPFQQESVEKNMLSVDQANANNPFHPSNQKDSQSISIVTGPGASDKTFQSDPAKSIPSVTQSSVFVQVESPIKIQKQKEEHTEIAGLTKTAVEPDAVVPEKRKGENMWASLGMSTGNYNPGSTSNTALMSTVPSISSQGTAPKPAPGNAYSVGLALGKRVANRWVVQAGINYLNQSTAYSSNVTSIPSGGNVPSAMDMFNLSSSHASAVTFTNPYQINSTLEFISVPVQAGYLLVDRKVGFQMNAGIATDFFIRNSLQDQSGLSNSYSQGAGSESPYKSVNWAGLISTEMSYKVGRQYRVSVVPGVRYLFNSALKSGATTNSYMADIGFRFRYILR